MEREIVRVCVVGAGIAGLSASFYLSHFDNVEVTLIERAPHAGGRADIVSGGEHCPRIFLDDYHCLFEILRQIPSPNGGSVHGSLHRVVRYCYTQASGWVPISRLYRFRSREISLGERLGFAISRMRTPLVADTAVGPNTNRYGTVRNYSLRSAIWVIRNLLRSEYGYAFDRPTDEALIDPWLRYLDLHGVQFRPDTAAEAISARKDRILLRLRGVWESYDAVVVAAHLPDVIELLPTTPLAQARATLQQTHCTCLTMHLDPREDVIARGEVAVYSRNGLSVLVQPQSSRCIVMCLRCRSTETGWVVRQVTSILDLRFDAIDVHVRDNAEPSEGVYSAESLPVHDVAIADGPLYLAGAYLQSNYPLDSAECAARTAYVAVQQIGDRFNRTLSASLAATAPALARADRKTQPHYEAGQPPLRMTSGDA